ncbi:MAG: FadR/GntR family transcriptional regulator [Pseudomonadota bacterium]
MERYESTLTTLRDLLASGELSQSGRLPPERVLAGDLGVGRRTLRKALSALEQEGRILRRQGRGTFIAQPTSSHVGQLEQTFEHTNPIEVMEVRLAIEPVMARLASVRASRCDIERLTRLADQTRTAEDAATYERADAAFHRKVAEAARNVLFLSIYDALADVRRDASWSNLDENARCFNRQALYAGLHVELVQAIAARDGDRAHQVMYSHLSDVQAHIAEKMFPSADPVD